jgi:hypothetical protein
MMSWKHFSGHRDVKSKTGDNSSFPGRMTTLERENDEKIEKNKRSHENESVPR